MLIHASVYLGYLKMKSSKRDRASLSVKKQQQKNRLASITLIHKQWIQSKNITFMSQILKKNNLTKNKTEYSPYYL